MAKHDPETEDVGKLATRALKKGDRPGILELVQQLGETAETRETGIWLARLQDAAGQPQAALETRQGLVRQYPKRGGLRAELARNLEQSGKHAAALTVLQEGLELLPDDRDLLHAKLDHLRRNSPVQDVLGEAKALSSKHRDWPPARILLSQCLADSGQLLEAVREIEDIEAQVPGHAGIARAKSNLDKVMRTPGGEAGLLRQCVSAIDKGVNPALAVLEDLNDRDCAFIMRAALAEASHGTNSTSLLAVAETRRALGDTALAILFFARAIEEDPDLHRARTELSACFTQLGRDEDARRVIETGLEKNPSDFWLLIRQTHLDLGAKPDSVSEDAVTALRDRHPERPAGHRLVLRYYMERGEFDAAGKAVEAFSANCPNAVSLEEEQARIALMRGDAAGCLRHCEEVAPTMAVLDLKAAAAGALGDAESQTEALEQLLSLPTSGERDHLLGKIAFRLGRTEEAVEHIRRATEADPLAPKYWWQLLVALVQLGQSEQALRELDRAPPSVQASGQAAARRLHALRILGKFSESLRLFRSLPEKIAKTPQVLIQHVLSLADIGKHEEATKVIRHWSPSNARDSWIRHMAAAQAQLIDFDVAEALSECNKAERTDIRHSGSHTFRAKARLMAFDPAGVISDLDAANELDRSSGTPERRQRDGVHGGIANEFLLDRGVTEEIAALSANHAPPERFAEVVLRTDGMATAPAMGLLIALRQAGRLCDHRPDVGPVSDQPGTIPEQITQYWEGSAPPDDLEAAMQALARHNRWAEYTRFDHDMARDYLSEHAGTETQRAFRLCRHAAARADLFRLVRLIHDGGIYVDADDLCTGDLRAILPPGKSLVLYQEDIGSIGNNFIATAPGDDLLRRVLDEVVASLLSGGSEEIWLQSGPGALSRAFAYRIARREGLALDPGTAVLPLSVVKQRLQCGAPFSYKFDSRHWVKAGRDRGARSREAG